MRQKRSDPDIKQKESKSRKISRYRDTERIKIKNPKGKREVILNLERRKLNIRDKRRLIMN